MLVDYSVRLPLFGVFSVFAATAYGVILKDVQPSRATSSGWLFKRDDYSNLDLQSVETFLWSGKHIERGTTRTVPN
jgi:hypothetical protein